MANLSAINGRLPSTVTSTFCQQDPFGCSAVLAPDGIVFAVDGCRYASLDEWIEVVRADWKAACVNACRAAVRIVQDRGGVRS